MGDFSSVSCSAQAGMFQGKSQTWMTAWKKVPSKQCWRTPEHWLPKHWHWQKTSSHGPSGKSPSLWQTWLIQGSCFGVVVVVVVLVVVVLWGAVVELDTLLWTRSVGRESVRERDRMVSRRSFMMSWLDQMAFFLISWSDGCFLDSDSPLTCANVLNPFKSDNRPQFSQ